MLEKKTKLVMDLDLFDFIRIKFGYKLFFYHSCTIVFLGNILLNFHGDYFNLLVYTLCTVHCTVWI